MMVKRGLNESFATVSMFTHPPLPVHNNRDDGYNHVIKTAQSDVHDHPRTGMDGRASQPPPSCAFAVSSIL